MCQVPGLGPAGSNVPPLRSRLAARLDVRQGGAVGQVSKECDLTVRDGGDMPRCCVRVSLRAGGNTPHLASNGCSRGYLVALEAFYTKGVGILAPAGRPVLTM